MFPPAPVLFSTMMGWPHLTASLSAAMRASTSLMPPPGNGMMNLTGLAGNPDATCPRTGNAVAVKITSKPSAVTRGHMPVLRVENGQDMPSTTRRNRRDQDCTRVAGRPFGRDGHAVVAVPLGPRAGYGA